MVGRLLLLLTLLAPNSTAATLRGTVTANEIKPLSGATVRIREEGGERVLATATNEEGLYEIPSVKDGNYLLEVEYRGLLLVQRVVRLQGPTMTENVDVCAYSPTMGRWPIRTSVLPTANLDRPKKIALQDLMALPNPQGVKRQDVRYQSTRIPPSPNVPAVAEGDIVTTEGWVRAIIAQASGDWEIKISPTITSKETLIAKAPPGSCVNSPGLQEAVQGVRDEVRAEIMPGGRPAMVINPPVRVRITGQLFFNTAHIGDPHLRLAGGFPTRSLWELNPIVAVAVQR